MHKILARNFFQETIAMRYGFYIALLLFSSPVICSGVTNYSPETIATTSQTNYQPNVSHVMIYIGKTAQGRLLMAGASDGRTYKGRKIYGVSVFDFQLPNATSASRFLGYSCIPQFTCKNTH